MPPFLQRMAAFYMTAEDPHAGEDLGFSRSFLMTIPEIKDFLINVRAGVPFEQFIVEIRDTINRIARGSKK